MSPGKKTLLSFIKEVCGGADASAILSTAELAHGGQVRRSGEPYIEHPIAVANIINQYYPGERLLCTAALLHDTLEDAVENGNFKDEQELVDTIQSAYSSPEDGQEVLSIVYALTHEKSIPYTEYVMNLASNASALKIKLADMLHNLSHNPSPKQIIKYGSALNALAGGGVPSGIHPDHWAALMSITNPVVEPAVSESIVRDYIRACANEKQ